MSLYMERQYNNITR